jgi:DNA-binding beta-propeller fold protein YncE
VAVELVPLGGVKLGGFGKSAAEISAFDPASKRLFVVNGESDRLEVLSIADPTKPAKVGQVDLSRYGVTPNSVAIHKGVAAVAMTGKDPQGPGRVVFLNAKTLKVLSDVEVGAMPDMVTFTPDGTRVLTADEGEPDLSYGNDPEGSVSIIDVRKGFKKPKRVRAGFEAFNFANVSGVKRVGPGQSFPQDAEPEYIAVSPDSKTAFVTLQEINALAVVDIGAGKITQVVGLGFKDWGNSAFDASDKDGIAIAPHAGVFGVYQPDAIAAVPNPKGGFLLLTANEGDVKDFSELGGTYNEETRAEKLTRIAPVDDPALNRLKVFKRMGDGDGDGKFETLYAVGGRSVSLWSPTGVLQWDSGDALEQASAKADGTAGFNATHDKNDPDSRSDDKGPEPEGLAVGEVGGKTLAFVGLERTSAIAVFDLTDPDAPRLAAYVNGRDWAQAPKEAALGDHGPEGLAFIPAAQSPNGKPILVVTNEIASTVKLWEVRP